MSYDVRDLTRIESMAIALCRRSLPLLPPGFNWRDFTMVRKHDHEAWRAAHERDRTTEYGDFYRLVDSRKPPLPGLQRLYGDKEPANHCPLCGQRTFGQGDWRERAGAARWNKRWHTVCWNVIAVWTKTNDFALRFAVHQGGICPITGERVMAENGTYVYGDAQVDHIVPLWRVRADAHLYRWPDVLKFWGPTNLQTLSSRGHLIKTSIESTERANMKRRPPQPDLFVS